MSVGRLQATLCVDCSSDVLSRFLNTFSTLFISWLFFSYFKKSLYFICIFNQLVSSAFWK